MIQILAYDPLDVCPKCKEGVLEFYEYRNADAYECRSCDYVEAKFYPEAEWDLEISETLNPSTAGLVNVNT